MERYLDDTVVTSILAAGPAARAISSPRPAMSTVKPSACKNHPATLKDTSR